MASSLCSGRESKSAGIPTLKLTVSKRRSNRLAKGLMDSSGMFRNSSAEMYPCSFKDT